VDTLCFLSCFVPVMLPLVRLHPACAARVTLREKLAHVVQPSRAGLIAQDFKESSFAQGAPASMQSIGSSPATCEHSVDGLHAVPTAMHGVRWLASVQVQPCCSIAMQRSMSLTWVLLLLTGPYRYAMRGSVVAFTAVA
jgi:hypothetical protein